MNVEDKFKELFPGLNYTPGRSGKSPLQRVSYLKECLSSNKEGCYYSFDSSKIFNVNDDDLVLIGYEIYDLKTPHNIICEGRQFTIDYRLRVPDREYMQLIIIDYPSIHFRLPVIGFSDGSGFYFIFKVESIDQLYEL